MEDGDASFDSPSDDCERMLSVIGLDRSQEVSWHVPIVFDPIKAALQILEFVRMGCEMGFDIGVLQ